MNKKVNLIIGSGVLGAYLSANLIKKKEKVIQIKKRDAPTPVSYTHLRAHET